MRYKYLVIIFILALLLLYQPYHVSSQSDLVPVPNASIVLNYQDGSVLHLTTDANGVAKALVRPGIYPTIHVSGAGIEAEEQWDVTIDSDNNVLNFTVNKAQWLVGTITSDDDVVAGAKISGPNSVFSDAEGKYTLSLDGNLNPLLSFNPGYSDQYRIMFLYGNLIGGAAVFQPSPLSVESLLIIPFDTVGVVYKKEQLDMGPYIGQELVQHDVQLNRA